MNKIVASVNSYYVIDMILILIVAVLFQVSAEDEYTKYSSNKDGKVILKLDDKNEYKRPEKVLVKLNPTNKQDYYDQESYSEENPIKTGYDVERNQGNKYIYEYLKDQQYSDESRDTYKQRPEEKIEKISNLLPQPVYVNLNLKKDEQEYIPDPTKINLNFKINNDGKEEYTNQDQQYDVSKLLTNYGIKPKKVLVNVKIRKHRVDYYDQGKLDQQDGPKNININVKISKVQEPKIYEQKEVRETVLDKLYKVSKKYTGL